MKLTISRKLLLGYLAMAALTVMASIYAILSLQDLNSLANTIIDHDVVVIETSKSLMDTLNARESAERKYLILKDPSIADLYWARSRDFSKKLSELRTERSSGMNRIFSRISSLHKQYDDIFRREVNLINDNQPVDALVLSDSEGRKIVEDISSQLNAIQKKADHNVETRMSSINKEGAAAARVTIVLSVISLVGGLLLALLITYNISLPLKKLEKATALIAEGQFDLDFKMDRKDEIGSLAQAFSVMAERLKVLDAINRDASPLTGLPGNLAIEKEIERRLSEKTPFSLCHIDLDNFKPFADKYGYAWGSEVIKEVANILTNHLKVNGNGDVFVGHIGGDDFVLISEPAVAENLCRQLVEKFDRHIESFYSEQDRQKKFIVGKDRKGREQTFPLITVTASIVTDNGTHFSSPLAMAKKAAELKEYGKTLSGSNYVKQEDMKKST